MKKKAIILSTIIVFIYLCYRYMGIFIFWLFTPGDGELRPAEKILFEEVKKKSEAIDIYRGPKYHISNPKDTLSYGITIKLREKNKLINKDSLKIEAKNIAVKIENLLNLHPNFVNYVIHYESSGEYGCDEYFKFKRAEIKKLNIKK
ncbi:hypothetical protein [Flavobacterium davisii]|nr:hypothetical protein [Flavobacterium davisii]